MGNQPRSKIEYNGIEVTEWENKGSKNGREFSFRTYSVGRSYKKGDEWQNTNAHGFRKNDLPKLIAALTQMYHASLAGLDGDE